MTSRKVVGIEPGKPLVGVVNDLLELGHWLDTNLQAWLGTTPQGLQG